MPTSRSFFGFTPEWLRPGASTSLPRTLGIWSVLVMRSIALPLRSAVLSLIARGTSTAYREGRRPGAGCACVTGSSVSGAAMSNTTVPTNRPRRVRRGMNLSSGI